MVVPYKTCGAGCLQDAKAAEKAAKKAKAAAKQTEREAKKAAGPTDKQQKAKDEAEAKKVHNTRTLCAREHWLVYAGALGAS